MQCVVCGLPAIGQCGKCKRVFYCETECQKDDWETSHSIACPVLLGDPMRQILEATDVMAVLGKLNNNAAFNLLVNEMEKPYEWKKISKDVRRKLSHPSYDIFWKKRSEDSCGPIVKWGLPVRGSEPGTIKKWFKAWFQFQLGNAILQEFISSLPESSIITIPVDVNGDELMSLLIDKLEEQFKVDLDLQRFQKYRRVGLNVIGLAVSTPPHWSRKFHDNRRHIDSKTLVTAGVWLRYKFGPRIDPAAAQFTPHMSFGSILMRRQERIAALLAMRFLLQVSLQQLGKLSQENDRVLNSPFDYLVEGVTMENKFETLEGFAKRLNLARKEARAQYIQAFEFQWEDIPDLDMSALED